MSTSSLGALIVKLTLIVSLVDSATRDFWKDAFDRIGRIGRLLMRTPLRAFIVLLIVMDCISPVFAGTPEDRTAVERIYYNHRTGNKVPFKIAVPDSLIRQLVENDLKKEYLLKKVYGITITDTELQAEVDRINASTRAPQMLAELKAALGNDPRKFAESVAKPILVERILRSKFSNDDSLHSAQRIAAESIRKRLLGAISEGLHEQITIMKESGLQVNDVKWSMIPREGDSIQRHFASSQASPEKGNFRDGRYSIESSVKVLSKTLKHNELDGRMLYFEDLHPDLQRVLDHQMQTPGNVSAVVELPVRFQVFLLINRTALEMEVMALTVQKQNFDVWLHEID